MKSFQTIQQRNAFVLEDIDFPVEFGCYGRQSPWLQLDYTKDLLLTFKMVHVLLLPVQLKLQQRVAERPEVICLNFKGYILSINAKKVANERS